MNFEEFAKDYNHYSYKGFEYIWKEVSCGHFNGFVKLPKECESMFTAEDCEILLKGFFQFKETETFGYKRLDDCLVIGFKNCYRWSKWINDKELIETNLEKLVQLISFEHK